MTAARAAAALPVVPAPFAGAAVAPRRRAAQPAIRRTARSAASTAPAVTVRPVTVRRPWRARLFIGLAVPGLLATSALPAYALTGDESGALPDAGALLAGQSFVVSSQVQAPELSREGYSARSSAEIAVADAMGAGSYDSAAALDGYLNGNELGWWRPLPGPITSPYGPRGLICNGAGCSNSFHEGIDFGNACGTPIRATANGTVTFVGNAGGFGNRVIIDHGDGTETIYGHIKAQSYQVAVGDQVAGGQVIAEVGATGVVSGCHLDLKVQIDGEKTDPDPFLRSKGVVV